MGKKINESNQIIQIKIYTKLQRQNIKKENKIKIKINIMSKGYAIQHQQQQKKRRKFCNWKKWEKKNRKTKTMLNKRKTNLKLKESKIV